MIPKGKGLVMGGNESIRNRLRIRVGRCQTTLKKWNILRKEEAINWKCDEIQKMNRLLQCPLIRTIYDNNDLHSAKS